MTPELKFLNTTSEKNKTNKQTKNSNVPHSWYCWYLDINKENDSFLPYRPNHKLGLLNKIYTILLKTKKKKKKKEENIDVKLKETLLQRRPVTPQQQISPSKTLWFESIYMYSISLIPQGVPV